jgi:hypothetical protein
MTVRRQLSPFKSHEALIAAVAGTPESTREVCAVHGWSPHVPPGAPLPPPSKCPLCIREAAYKPKGPDVPIFPGTEWVTENPRYEAAWEKWQEDHPEAQRGPQPGSFEEAQALVGIQRAREDRESGIDRDGHVVVYRSLDGTRVQYGRPRRRRRLVGTARAEFLASLGDDFWG